MTLPTTLLCPNCQGQLDIGVTDDDHVDSLECPHCGYWTLHGPRDVRVDLSLVS